MFWSQVISLQMQPKPFNTLRPRQNGCHFVDDTFKRIFMNENVRISINISLKFVPKGLINNIPALVQIMAWRREGDKPLSEPMMINLLTHICVTRPQCGTMLHRTAYRIRIRLYLQVKYINMFAHSKLYYYTMTIQWSLYYKFTKALINMCYNKTHML